jgi:hypothetical protein
MPKLLTSLFFNYCALTFKKIPVMFDNTDTGRQGWFQIVDGDLDEQISPSEFDKFIVTMDYDQN